jgi:hypothetical protein
MPVRPLMNAQDENVRSKETYEGCVDVAFEQRDPGMAFVSRLDVLVAFQLVERADLSIHPRWDVLCRQQLAVGVIRPFGRYLQVRQTSLERAFLRNVTSDRDFLESSERYVRLPFEALYVCAEDAFLAGRGERWWVDPKERTEDRKLGGL